MPPVIIKLAAGRADQQKSRIADLVAAAGVAGAECGAEAVSVSIEDVAASDWVSQVYQPEILDKPAQLYHKPGYDPFSKT